MITNKEKKDAYGDLITSPELTKTILAVLAISGAVSVSSSLMMVDKFNVPTDKMYYFVIGGIFLLILLDYVKRMFFSNFINSEIEAPVTGQGKSNLSFIMTILTVLAVLMIDLLGSYSTAIMVETEMKKDSVTNSLDYEILQKNKESEAITLSSSAYQSALDKYNQNKQQHIDNCNEAWSIPRYRTKNGQCMDKFKEETPVKSDFTVSSSINKADIEKIKEENTNLFVEYVFYFVFGIVGLILGVMNYLTLNEMVQKRRAILTLLTDTRVSIIKGFLSKLQQMKDEETRDLLSKVEEHTEEVAKQKIEAKELELALSRNTDEALLNQLKTNVKDGNVTAQNYTIKKRGSKSKNQKSSESTNQEKFDAEILRKRLLNEYDENGKIVSKTKLIDPNNREQDKLYKLVIKELVSSGLVTYKRGYGYYIA